MSSETKLIYRVTFWNQSQVYEVYARRVFASQFLGFIEIEQYIFGNRAQLLVDPSEEKLKNELNGVRRSYVPIHSVIRIDEVEHEGVAKISDGKGGSVMMFPSAHFSPPPKSS